MRVTPFATLLHFKKETPQPQPRVLLVAPMSGHFATLLRHTVRTMLPEHDIYITDWHNARDVPLSAGDFDFDDFIDQVIQCLEVLGRGFAYRRGMPAGRRGARRGVADGAGPAIRASPAA